MDEPDEVKRLIEKALDGKLNREDMNAMGQLLRFYRDAAIRCERAIHDCVKQLEDHGIV